MDIQISKVLNNAIDKLAQCENELSNVLEDIKSAKEKLGESETLSAAEIEVDNVYRSVCDSGVTIDALLKESSKK